VCRGYFYGYQGSEADDDIKGDGNSYTTDYRFLDVRIGRWLSLDPLMARYPHQSPFCAMDNNPIVLNDPRGLSTDDWVGKTGENGETTYTWKNSDYQLKEGEFFAGSGFIGHEKGTDKYFRLENEGKWSYVTEATYQAKVNFYFDPSKYYRVGQYGLEESGPVYSDAVNGTIAQLAVMNLLFEQEETRKLDMPPPSYLQIQTMVDAENAQQLEANRESIRGAGFAGVLYMFSGLETVDYALQDIRNEEYGMALLGIGVEFLPFDEALSPLLRRSRSTFAKFKRANPADIGSDGYRMEWHHLVEQHADNLRKFGVDRIHDASNLVLLEKTIHQKITTHFHTQITINGKYYSHARDYVKTLDWDQQMQYMLDFMNSNGF
jgi:RHS repeat-associated protein